MTDVFETVPIEGDSSSPKDTLLLPEVEMLRRKELTEFRNDINLAMELKATELGVSKEKLLELLPEIDLESISEDRLVELNLDKRDLEFIKENIEESIRQVWKNKDGEILTGQASKTSGLIEFISRHNREVSLAQLAIYLSAFGTATAIKYLADVDAKVVVDGERISLADIVDNPELMDNINPGDSATPTEISLSFSQPQPFKYADDAKFIYDVDLALSDSSDGISEKMVHMYYYGDGVEGELWIKCLDELSKIGVDFSNEDGYPLPLFAKHKDDIARVLSKNLGVPEIEVKEYNQKLIDDHIPRLSVVALGDFNIPVNKTSMPLSETSLGYNNDMYTLENNSVAFEELFLETLEKDGYNIEELKMISEENPKEIIIIIADIIARNVEYDQYEADAPMEYRAEKHEGGIPWITLKTGLGVCHDYACTFIAAKKVLEDQGIPNLENVACLYASSDSQLHAWVALATMDDDGNIKVTYIDPTWYDVIPGRLNAVDRDHFWEGYDVQYAYEETLRKIMEMNLLVQKENLESVLKQYLLSENSNLDSSLSRTRKKIKDTGH
jgi:hypothetical protein